MKVCLASLFLLIAILLSSAPASATTREWGYDRPGMDYFNFVIEDNRVVHCEWKCMQDRRCKAWTFVKPGYQGQYSRCWLKHSVPRLVRNNCCDSGTP